MCVYMCVQKEAPPSQSRSRQEVKLMEKIPERAEATVVLVGTPSHTSSLSQDVLQRVSCIPLLCLQEVWAS